LIFPLVFLLFVQKLHFGGDKSWFFIIGLNKGKKIINYIIIALGNHMGAYIFFLIIIILRKLYLPTMFIESVLHLFF
jgi:hypothetical protein